MSHTESEKILMLAIEVNSLLSRYVQLHDECFKFSWRRVIPIPGLFKAIEFGKLQSQARKIADALDLCARKAISLTTNTPQERNFVDLMGKYIAALKATIEKLSGILAALDAKTDDIISSKYSSSRYNSDVAAYDKLVAEYTELGDRLNESMNRLRASYR